MPALKGYAEFASDLPRLGVTTAKGGLGVAKEIGRAGIDLGQTAFSTAKLIGKVGLSAAKHTMLAPFYLAKGLGNAYHYGREGVATASGSLDKLKKAPMPARLAAFGAGLWAINKMDEAAQRLGEARRTQDQMAKLVTAAVNDEKPNIPVDNSKPNSNSPEDYTDYYDYQEWSSTKGNNYPEREEAELNSFDNPHKSQVNYSKYDNDPHKVAHILGLDDSIDRVITGYTAHNYIKVATTYLPESYTALKERKGSAILGAAIAATPFAVATAYINPVVYDGRQHTWDRPYMH